MSARLVKDINLSGSSSPRNFISIGGILYFTAESQGTRTENSTETNNEEDADDNSDNEDQSDNEEGTDNEDQSENDSNADNSSDTSSTEAGMGLWKSDGSEGGSILLKTFESVSNLVESNGILYFIAKLGGSFEIWSSDGTSGGTRRVDALYPGGNNFAAYNLHSVNDSLFFSASGPDGDPSGYELWRWEGGDVGTKLFKNLFPDRYIKIQSEEKDEETNEITLTIETEEFSFGTPEYSPDSFPGNFTSVGGGNFFFTAYSSIEYFFKKDLDCPPPAPPGREYNFDNFADKTKIGGIELWFSDGTEGNTVPIRINKKNYEIYNPVSGSFTPPCTYENYYTASGSSFPKELTAFDSKLYFAANNGTKGFELWSIPSNVEKSIKKTRDENPEATYEEALQLTLEESLELVKNINPNASSNPKELTVVGKNLYFTADPGKGSGPKLFILKAGKNNKPKTVKNSGKNPQNLTNINDSLYYSAISGKGREPWIAQGTKANQMQDISPGSASSNPSNFEHITKKDNNQKQNLLFFTANNGQKGFELWSKNLNKKNDKSKLFADIYPGLPSSYPGDLMNSNEALFFSAADSKSGRELWTVDFPIDDQENNNEAAGGDQSEDGEGNNGSGSGNKSEDDGSLIKDIKPGKASSNPAFLHNQRGKLYFSADNGKYGDEVWTSQGSNNSTKIFKDINKGRSSSSPSDFTSDKSLLYFSANGGKKGQELWMTNGKAKSTERLSDLNPGSKSSSPSDLLVLNQKLFFAADDGRNGRELWRYSIKSDTFSMVRDIHSGYGIGSNPSQLTLLNNQIIFAAEGNTYGRELWISDGNHNSTQLLKDIYPGALSSNPDDLNLMAGDVYLTANTYLNGRQILKLDGESMNISEVIGSSGGNIASDPDDLHATDVQLFYSAETSLDPSANTNSSTASTDGTTGSGSDPDGFMIAANGLGTNALEDIENYNGGIDNYRESDNADEENRWIKSARLSADSLAKDDDNPDGSLAKDWNQYFQPLFSDPSKPATAAPIEIPEGIPSTAARRSTTSSAGDSNLTPDAESNDNSLGRELWISSGEDGSNTLLKDINPGAGSSNPSSFTTVGAMTYFSADDGEFGDELWISDGTESGTYRLTDINEGARDSSPRSITEFNDLVYFSAKSDSVGRELWRFSNIKSKSKVKASSRTQNKAIDLTRIEFSGKGKKNLQGKSETSDEFIFATKNQFGNKKSDRITGFSSKDGDTLQLDQDSFPGLNKIRFQATTSIDQFNKEMSRDSSMIYFQPSGELYFDANGRQPGLGDEKQSGLFAILKDGPALSGSDIAMI